MANSQDEYGSLGGAGGIFGPQAADHEMIDAELQGIEHRDDGTYIDHARALRERRAKKAERQEMLVLQRMIDEIPDFLAWMKKRARDRALLTIARVAGLDRDTPDGMFVMEGQEDTITGRKIAGEVVQRVTAGVREGVTDFVARIAYRAYMRDQVERDRAFSTLRGAEEIDAAETFAQRVASRVVDGAIRAAGMGPSLSEPAQDGSVSDGADQAP